MEADAPAEPCAPTRCVDCCPKYEADGGRRPEPELDPGAAAGGKLRSRLEPLLIPPAPDPMLRVLPPAIPIKAPFAASLRRAAADEDMARERSGAAYESEAAGIELGGSTLARTGPAPVL